MLALLPNNLDLAAGLVVGGLAMLSLIAHHDANQEKRRSMPTIPDNVAASSAELQAVYDEALAKATEAQLKETEAVQARDTAETAKGSGREANARLQAKAAAHLALLTGFYQPPVLPPPAIPAVPATPAS